MTGIFDRNLPKQEVTDDTANDFLCTVKEEVAGDAVSNASCEVTQQANDFLFQVTHGVTGDTASNASCGVARTFTPRSHTSHSSGYGRPRTVQRYSPVVPEVATSVNDRVSLTPQHSLGTSVPDQVGVFSSGITFDYSRDLAARFSVSSPHNISWAHAVNSREKLTDALQNPRKHMLEVDVQLGIYAPDGTRSMSSSAVASCAGTRSKHDHTVVCAHPPFTTSDLTLLELLSLVCEHNDACNTTSPSAQRTENTLNDHQDDASLFPPSKRRTPKGIKLDFKSNSVIATAIALCATMNVCDRVPTLWLNADVLPGPGALYGISVIPGVSFVERCAALPAAVISLGWKATEYSMAHSSYSAEMVDAMIDLLRQVRIQNAHVTFAVSATYTLPSLPEFARLLHECGAQDLSASLTVWTGVGSPGISEHVQDEILETTKKCNIGVFMDVITRKPGRSCNASCVIA